MKLNEIFSKVNEEKEDTLELPDLNVGDELMVGKFKNRKAEIKGFKKDKHNQPVAKTNKGDQTIFKGRVKKLMPENLDESFDKAYPYQWTDQKPLDWYGSFTEQSGKTVDVSISGYENGTWVVSFETDKETSKTGSGDQFKIFATVVAMLQDFVTKIKPKEVMFVAEKDPNPSGRVESRVNLYSRLLNRFAKALGYSFEKQEQGYKSTFRMHRNEKLDEDINAVEIENIVKPVIRRMLSKQNVWESPGAMSSTLRKGLGKIIKDYIENLGLKRSNVIIELNLTTNPNMSGSMLYNHKNGRAMFTLLLPKEAWKQVKNTSGPKGIDLWEDLVEDLQQTVVHELMHSQQWIKSKAKIGNRKGYLSAKDTSDTKEIYLSDKHELSPYAANAVQELLHSNINLELALKRLNEQGIIQALAIKSPTFNQFYNKFGKSQEPKRKKVWNRFIRKFVLHIGDRIKKDIKENLDGKKKEWVNPDSQKIVDVRGSHHTHHAYQNPQKYGLSPSLFSEMDQPDDDTLYDPVVAEIMYDNGWVRYLETDVPTLQSTSREQIQKAIKFMRRNNYQFDELNVEIGLDLNPEEFVNLSGKNELNGFARTGKKPVSNMNQFRENDYPDGSYEVTKDMQPNPNTGGQGS